MKKLFIFTDGSVNATEKVGCGAYLVIDNLEQLPNDLLRKTKLKIFDNTSSTKLEIQTMLWALSEINTDDKEIVVFTDSQNILGLAARRTKLEANSYYSSKNKLLNNHEQYKEFYEITDRINPEFVKVKGHMKSCDKDFVDKLFTLVDKASRKGLRDYISNSGL